MESINNASNDQNKANESVKQNSIIKDIKSNYVLQKLFGIMSKRKKLEITKYNKKIQNRLNLCIKNYKNYYETFTPIEIEIIPKENEYCQNYTFININKKDKLYFHIYFNDNEKEIKNKYEIYKEDKVTKIKIIIDYQVISFQSLFFICHNIESINFKKCYRTNINNMSHMFDGCSSLKELNLSNLNTSNVTDMSHMFNGCSSLKKLNLSNFNTSNVTNMSYMFYECSSLNELILSNFNISNVINMSYMFYECSSLNELNLSNFNISNDTDMSCMFYNISDNLRNKIILENKIIEKEAFYHHPFGY